MSVNVTGPYIYFTIPIFGGINVTQTMVSSILVTAILCIACVVLGKSLTTRPSGKQVLLEKGISMMHCMVVDTMGAHNAHWTPFIITVFISSITGSLIGMTGFLRSTTADLSTTITWAIMVSVIIWYNSIKNNGFGGWLKGFTEPMIPMTPMNIISEIAQPVSMAFRHFGNVAGGGVISALLYAALTLASTALLNLITASGWAVSGVLVAAGILLLVAWLRKRKKAPLIFGILSLVLGLCGLLQATGLLVGIPILTYGIPALLSCYFDIFSGFIQAYVFTLLTVIYIAGSLPNSGE